MALVVWKKYALTLVIWKKYTLTHCVWKVFTLTLADRKADAMACIVRMPHALTLVDTKKRRRFDNRRPEGYCSAYLRLVRIRTAGTHWERHVHWQAQSGSIYGGTRR